VQEWVESRRSENLENRKVGSSGAPEFWVPEFSDRSGIVHRLDRETSGLLVIAKTPEAFAALKNQFQERTVVKKYLALVHGEVKPAEGMICAPVERSPFNRKHFGVFPGGRRAETSYRLIKTLKKLKNKDGEETLSLLELSPKTGRTHQIRVHLKYVNHPIVSDPIYGGRKQCREDLKFCPRLFLHAACLEFTHPVSNERLTFVSELPPSLAAVLELLAGDR
jgi:23S rRNA pseudouridine1911/1915/1917 synthase